MQELFPGLYQLTITLEGIGPGSVNVYLIRDKDSYTIVDTGWDTPASVKSLEKQLAETGVSFAGIKKVILTHSHPDHLGMVARFKKINQAAVYLHHKEIELMKVRCTAGNDYWPSIDRFLESHGVPGAELSAEFPLPDTGDLILPDVILEGGEELAVGEYTLHVINSPGHTPGHICLYESTKRFLISGDVLLPTIATNAAGHIRHMLNPLQQYLKSLNLLKTLDIDLVLPGHEYPFSNHRKRIDELFEHHRQRSEAIVKVLQSDSGARTAYEVARLIPWAPKLKFLTWDDLNGIDKRFAMMQVIAHLEALTAAGKLTRFSREGKIFYLLEEQI